MLLLRTFSRSIIPLKTARHKPLFFNRLLSQSSSSDSSDSGSDSDKESSKVKPSKSIKDLNSFSRKNDFVTSTEMDNVNQEKKASRIDVAIPRKEQKLEVVKEEEPEDKLKVKITDAAKLLAEKLGGDTKKTEMDLLDKLFRKKSLDSNVKFETDESSLNQSDILKGAKIVSGRKSRYELNLEIQRVKQIREIANKVDKMEVKLKDNKSVSYGLLKEERGEKVKARRTKDGRLISQAAIDSDKESFTFRYHNRIFGIFTKKMTGEPTVPDLSTWTELKKKELKQILHHPPQNYFQEMIQLTEEGKVWHFPIDNEQGIGEEKDVPFTEHIFLERHLKDWCPKQGPIRHFMELVCVGLSKNPYMTVQEKKDHIMWYKDYFGDKRELLMEVGAVRGDETKLLPKPTKKIDLGPHV